MREGMEALGRIRAQGIALLFITFLVGLLAGFAAERVRSARSTLDAAPQRLTRPLRPGHLPPMFHHLDLTPAQRERIVEIMEGGRPRTEAILSEMLPRLRAVTDSIHEEIRGVLTPDQVERWDSLLTQMHGRRRMMGPRMRGGAEPPPGGRRDPGGL